MCKIYHNQYNENKKNKTRKIVKKRTKEEKEGKRGKKEENKKGRKTKKRRKTNTVNKKNKEKRKRRRKKFKFLKSIPPVALRVMSRATYRERENKKIKTKSDSSYLSYFFCIASSWCIPLYVGTTMKISVFAREGRFLQTAVNTHA